MFEPSPTADAADADAPELKAPAPDPYGDVALGVECAWPTDFAS